MNIAINEDTVESTGSGMVGFENSATTHKCYSNISPDKKYDFDKTSNMSLISGEKNRMRKNAAAEILTSCVEKGYMHDEQ